MANSGKVRFPGGLTVYVQAVANAGYKQKVTITPPSVTGAAAAVFSNQGNAEGNVPIPLTTPGFLNTQTNGGQPFFTVPGNSDQLYTYEVSCTSGDSATDVEVNTSTYTTPSQGAYILATVVSEDSTDKDFNDSLTTFIAWELPSS